MPGTENAQPEHTRESAVARKEEIDLIKKSISTTCDALRKGYPPMLQDMDTSGGGH